MLLGTERSATTIRPGHTLSLDLLWCVRQRLEPDHKIRVQLVAQDGAVIAESMAPLGRAGAPASTLEPGHLVAGEVQLVVPATASVGAHRLRLSVIPAAGETALAVNWLLGGRAVDVGEVDITPWPLRTEFPPIATPLRADFGVPAMIELHGYELAKQKLAPGEETALTLFWRAADTIPDNYRVFLHLAGVDEEIWAQADGFPVDGFRPTTSWRAGEVIVDERTLDLPAAIPPGTYRIWLGFFDPETKQRLPIFVQGEPQAADRLLLTTLEIGR
jgi:hypothetical protein